YLDEYYTYDGIYRLTAAPRGQLNTGKTGITGTPLKEEDWTLDSLGNWTGYVQKATGTITLNQTRTFDKANAITGITGGSWTVPAYDANGNMTTMPQPATPTAGYTATYDAWNRLVQENCGAAIIAKYKYDGQNRRIVTGVN